MIFIVKIIIIIIIVIVVFIEIHSDLINQKIHLVHFLQVQIVVNMYQEVYFQIQNLLVSFFHNFYTLISESKKKKKKIYPNFFEVYFHNFVNVLKYHQVIKKLHRVLKNVLKHVYFFYNLVKERLFFIDFSFLNFFFFVQ